MPSLNEYNRKNNLHQVDESQNSILNAAETVFLRKGLENTSMGDIADQANVHRVTLYRYFPNRDPIAFEIAVRILKKIKTSTDISDKTIYLQAIKEDILAMIDQFQNLRDAYKYLGMFDHLYGEKYPSNELADWFKEEINAMRWGKGRFSNSIPAEVRSQLVVLLNTIMSFLEKMAARGELMADEQDVHLNYQLSVFREMAGNLLDDLISKY